MIQMEDLVFIPSPRAPVFRFAARPENLPLWNSAVLESRVVGALRVGTPVVLLIRLVGRTFETTHEVTAYEPCRRIAYTSIGGPMDVGGAMEFASERGGTLVHWVVCGNSHGFLRVADSMLLALGRREMSGCLENLKQVFADLEAAKLRDPVLAGTR